MDAVEHRYTRVRATSGLVNAIYLYSAKWTEATRDTNALLASVGTSLRDEEVMACQEFAADVFGLTMLLMNTIGRRKTIEF